VSRGEWEPQSRVVRVFADPVRDAQRLLYEPYVSAPASWQSTEAEHGPVYLWRPLRGRILPAEKA